MKLLKPNPDIETEKDLTLFLQKYLQAYQPATIDSNGYVEKATKRRSFSDLRELYLNYNPEATVTYDDMIKCLLNVKFELPTTHIAFRYCPDPKKVVIFATDSKHNHSQWISVCKDIDYWHEDFRYDYPGVDGLTDKYVIELLRTEFNKTNQNADK